MQTKPTQRPEDVEQRRFKRTRTLFSGTLIDSDRMVEVVVLDISVNGAKIRAPNGYTCKSRVKLKIDRLGLFLADVMWHRENRLGLRFVNAPEKIARKLPDSIAARLVDSPPNSDR
ncbi:MAG: PilZ domain-containing protein [Alphaproteobacteria bacterium]